MYISLVIPTYNRASLLRETLDSVVAQSYPHWECIVVDDGSTDETEAVVSEFGSSFHYVRQANGGPARARNRGMARAKGDAIMFLDSDDLLKPKALEQLACILKSNPDAGVAYGGFEMMGSDGRPVVLSVASEAPLLPSIVDASGLSETQSVAYGLGNTGQILPTLLQHDALVMGAALIRRQVFEQVEGFDPGQKYMEHWEYFLRIAKEGIAFVPTLTPMVRIRIHEGNLSGNLEEMLSNRLDLIDRYLPPRHSDAEHLRATARANAQSFLGMCLLYTDRFERGLDEIRKALSHRPLRKRSYDTFTERVCRIALDATDPLARLESMLDRLGRSANAKSLKYFALSRFSRMYPNSVTINGGNSVAREKGKWLTATMYRARSVWYLLRAVYLRPGIGEMYLKRGLTKLRKLRARRIPAAIS